MNNKIFGFGLLAFFAAVLFFSPALSKDSDDETIYTALAAKIQAAGFSAYNLRDVSIEPVGEFWKLSYEDGGNFLGLMAKSGVTYYDVPLYFNPPLFPAMLAMSHELFNHATQFVVLKKNQPLTPQWEQFYAVFPNALFSALFLWGVFSLGKKSFDETAGILAVLFCFVSPVFLITSFKVWSDLAAAVFLLWSFLIWRGRGKSILKVVLSGVLLGLAVLTRTSALFAVPLFFTKEWKPLSLWALTVFLVTAAWFYSMYHQYGNPFYFPDAGNAKDSLDWLGSISKPWYFYIADLFYLSPVFLAGAFAVKKNTRALLCWILLFLTPLSFLIYSRKPLGLEDRYLLPCYPALAVLAAAGIVRLRHFVPKHILVIGVSIASIWSFRLAILLVLSRESLSLVP